MIFVVLFLVTSGHVTWCVILSDFLCFCKHWTKDDDDRRTRKLYYYVNYIIIDWLMHFLWRGRTWNFKATWENKGSLLLSLSHFPCSWVPITATQLSPFPCNYSSELVPMATLSRPISGSTRRIHRTRHCIPYYMAIRRRI